MSEKPVNSSYEDEAPVAYALAEGEPLGSPVQTPVLTPGKSSELAPEPLAREWIGYAMADIYGLNEPTEVKVFVVDEGRVQMGHFTFSLHDAITLARTLLDAFHFIVQESHRARVQESYRARVEAELAALRQECEEAPV